MLIYTGVQSLMVVRSVLKIQEVVLTLFISLGIDPALLWPKDLDNPRGDLMGEISGPDGLLPQFLRDFGKTLIEK